MPTYSVTVCVWGYDGRVNIHAVTIISTAMVQPVDSRDRNVQKLAQLISVCSVLVLCLIGC